MNARLGLVLLAAIVSAVPGAGMPGGEQRSRQPYNHRRVSPPPPPEPRHIPSSYGWPGSFLPLSLPYQRPWVN